MNYRKIGQVALAMAIAGAIYVSGAVAVSGGATKTAPASSPVESLTPWGIDWGIGAACYKVSAFDSAISCVKVGPEELELFKKTLEAQRPS